MMEICFATSVLPNLWISQERQHPDQNFLPVHSQFLEGPDGVAPDNTPVICQLLQQHLYQAVCVFFRQT